MLLQRVVRTFNRLLYVDAMISATLSLKNYHDSLSRFLKASARVAEKKFFIDNLLVRIQFTIEMIWNLVDRPRAMGACISFSR